jgi:predicted MFS family arabinose efflux permease
MRASGSRLPQPSYSSAQRLQSTRTSLWFLIDTGGNATILAGLLVVRGIAGTVSNLLVGQLIDTIGNRKVLVTMFAFVLADFVLLPRTGANLWTAVPAVLLWGACGWGSSVPQQHRIVGIAPQIAPIVLGLNNSAVFLGTTAAGIVGAAGIQVLGTEKLGFISAVLVTAALIVSEFAARRIAAFNQGIASSQSSVVLPVSAAGQAEG